MNGLIIDHDTRQAYENDKPLTLKPVNHNPTLREKTRARHDKLANALIDIVCGFAILAAIVWGVS